MAKGKYRAKKKNGAADTAGTTVQKEDTEAAGESRAQAPVQEVARPAYAPAYEEQAPAYEENPYAEENEDLTPTATTIQYRTDLYAEERPAAAEGKKRFAMTAKGKLLMAVYAVVVAVVLALIIINTSVLRTLDDSVAAREAELNAALARAEQVANDIEVATSEDTIIEWGLENGMYFGD